MKNKLHQKTIGIENVEYHTQYTTNVLPAKMVVSREKQARVYFNKERFSSQAFLLDCHEC